MSFETVNLYTRFRARCTTVSNHLGTRNSPTYKTSSDSHSSFQRGRSADSGSSGRKTTTGKSRSTKHSKRAPDMLNVISQPRPITRKPSSPTPDTLPSTSNSSSLSNIPENLSKDDFCFAWITNNRKASRDERSFIVILKSSGSRMAKAMALQQKWNCHSLMEEVARRDLQASALSYPHGSEGGYVPRWQAIR